MSPFHPYHHHQTIRTKVFVSRHNTLNVTAPTILEYCQTQGLAQKIKQNATHVILRECPLCKKPTHDKLSNLYKFHIQIGGGAFFCHRCGNGGSWYDFKAHLGGYHAPEHPSVNSNSTTSSSGGSTELVVGGKNHNNNNSSKTIPCLPLPPARLGGFYSSKLLDTDDSNKPNNSNNPVLDYLLSTRKLNRKTLRKYGVGRATYKFAGDQGYQEAECVTFPWILSQTDLETQETLRGAIIVPPSSSSSSSFKKSEDEEDGETNQPNNSSNNKDATHTTFVTRRIKVRAVEQKAWQRLDPAGGGWGLFGLHTVPEHAKEIILTEGEYDAMAVHQATGRPAVSLPNGCRSLPVQVLPLLERFEKIYLWMDNDAPGQEGAEKFAKKLGLNRCVLVQCFQAKDANEALIKNLDMDQLLDQATCVPHERLLTFKDLRSEVLHELLQPDLYTGVPIPSLPAFTKLIKGFRRGEMTVLTGPTGSGKTTFLGQISLDLSEQAINVLWGSFEIKNTRLVHKLLKQFSRDSLPDSKDPNAAEKFNALADRFEDLPLHFMRFHGGSEVDDVLDAMEYAVYVNDVEHIILDNMQFMISRKKVSNNGSWDKFDVQDIAIEKFRKFATEHNVHLTLVVHPRKEDETSKLNISSFYGSAKATQEADTVIILQNDGRRKYIEVKKNRFDGTLGYAPLYFQSKSGRYVETEGEQGTSSSASSYTTVQPPTQNKAWKPRQNKQTLQDEDIPDLENHWVKCLGPK